VKNLEDKLLSKENELALCEIEWQEKVNHLKLQQSETDKSWKQKESTWKKKRRRL